MAKQLVTASVKAPGFYGLNSQESSVTLSEGFALKTENCVIDQYGRLGSRKGYRYITDTTLFPDILLQGGHEFVDITGSKEMVAWCESNFYISSGSNLTIITNNSSNVFGPNNFKCATLNDSMYIFDRDYSPMTYVKGSGQLVDNTDAPHANTCLSAYGRLWVADTLTDAMTVYWSDLLDGTNFSTGSAGSLDLTSILVEGADKIVALGAHAGRLIVFCEHNVVIFGDTDGDTILDPLTMRLVEVIGDVGCSVRDSVQNVGNDLLFLAEDGLHSLGRLIQEKGQPMTDISKNIRDELVKEINLSDKEKIRTVYSPRDAFYVMLLPDFNETYVFDVRTFLQDGSARVTSWENQSQTNMFMFEDELYFTHPAGVTKYDGYLDNVNTFIGAVGTPYTMKYYTNHIDFGDSTTLKHPKRMAMTVITQKNQDLTFRLGFDYKPFLQVYGTKLYNDYSAEWGVSEFGLAEFSTGELTETIRMSVGGSGNVMQAGFEAVITGYGLSIQRLDLYVKQGRIY